MAEAGPGPEFVDGWLVAQVLGEGAYGEVRLLVHAQSGAAVALKVTRAAGEGEGGEGAGGGGAGAAREAALHRALRHPHVLRCLGERAHPPHHYLFLEYAQGGELFDRIEPDVGMPEEEARRYWRQLAAGLQYLHGRGVAHRDIKPENLLLDGHDNLKISDFGMATLFRHGARERLVSRVCGTAPYCAPEVLRARTTPYRAPPADLWAAALVLLAMLAGELPWERAAADDERYGAWCGWLARAGPSPPRAGPSPPRAGPSSPPPPWHKLRPGPLQLLRRALQPSPQRRPDLARLLRHRWLDPHHTHHEHHAPEGAARAWASQPAVAGAGCVRELSAATMDALVSRSQPAPGPPALLGRRATRLLLPRAPRAVRAALLRAAAALGYTARPRDHTVVLECSVSLRMRAWVTSADDDDDGGGGGCVLELRRWRGCGLEFKRCFVRLRQRLLRDLGLPDQPHQPTDLDHSPTYL